MCWKRWDVDVLFYDGVVYRLGPKVDKHSKQLKN